MGSIGGDTVLRMENSEPVTLADLLEVDASLMVFYNKCGHHKGFSPVSLLLPPEVAIPDLTGRFMCSVCGSRETVAQPRYKAQDITLGSSSARGWILPPTEYLWTFEPAWKNSS